MSSIRLDKLLSNLGYCSRREVAFLIKEKRLRLNDVPLEKSDAAVTLEAARSGALTLDGEALDPPAPFTVMLHKPAGYICSHDEKGQLIYALLPERWQQRNPLLSSAGRLDKDSTGQVILTDDGALLHRITHPKTHAAKYYEVTLAKPLQGNEAELFASGTFLMQDDTKPLKPAIWEAKSANVGIMQLQEGRYHQIRRMFSTLGNEVVALHRFKTGGLALGDLPESEYRVLTESDIQLIIGATAA